MQFLNPIIYELQRMVFKPTYDYYLQLADDLNLLEHAHDALDLGMGTGQLAKYFRRVHYIGVDSDPQNVDRARQNYGFGTFHCLDMTQIASILPEKSIDIISIIGAFHHMTDKDVKLTLQAIRKILRDKGKLFIIEAEPPLFKFNLLGKLLRAMDKGAYIRSFNHNKNLLENNGWNITSSGLFSKQFLDYSYFLAN